MVAWLAAVSVGPPAEAQSCLGGPESFRLELGRFVTDLYALSETLERAASPVSRELHHAVATFDASVEKMTDAELAALCDLFHRYPEAIEAPRALRSIFPPAFLAGPATKADCLALSREDYLGLFALLNINNAIGLTFQTACDVSSCTAAGCVALCPIVAPFSVIALAIEGVLTEDNRCGLVTHYEAVEELVVGTSSALEAVVVDLESEAIPRLDEPLSSRASQASVDDLQVEISTVEAITGELGSLAAQLAGLSSDEQDFREQNRRLYIEENLQAGKTGQISSLTLPEALGGELETVREVVADAILMNLAAGQDVSEALVRFSAGDMALNAGDYSRAFFQYRLAYQEAADLPETTR